MVVSTNHDIAVFKVLQEKLEAYVVDVLELVYKDVLVLRNIPFEVLGILPEVLRASL